MVNGYSEALTSLWTGLATVTVLDNSLNASNGRTEKTERVLYTNQPCCVSHKTVNSVNPQNGAAVITQSAKLFISLDTDIPEGSKITVTQNGVTKTYVRSGNPAFYSAHQEIPVELCADRA